MSSDPEGVITGRLRDDILSGWFAPGERLVETSLSERYECGRAAIRAALVALSSEGLVSREANRGATVRRISVREVIEVTEARAALESLAAAHAARNATDEERAALQQLIVAMRQAVNSDEAARYSSLNNELHHKIRDVSRHSVAADLVLNLRNRTNSHQYRLALMPGRPETSLPQHEAIVEAIVSGDADGASAAMHKHLMSVIDVLERWEDPRAQ